MIFRQSSGRSFDEAVLLFATVLGIAAAAPAKADSFWHLQRRLLSLRLGRTLDPVNIACSTAPEAAEPAGRRGFGEAVPVHVAARQIVPEGISVVFGDGVDRELPVDWRGGGHGTCRPTPSSRSASR